MQSLDDKLHLLRNVSNMLHCESQEEYRAYNRSVKPPESLELNFDCGHRGPRNVGSHIAFNELFAYFKEEVDRAQARNELGLWIQSKEFLQTVQFLIFEFVAILKGDQYQKGVFLENLMKAMANSLESNLRSKLKQLWSNTSKMQLAFESQRSTWERSDNLAQIRIQALENQIADMSHDNRLLTLQLDRHKNQIEEYNNFHDTITLRIGAMTEMSKQLKAVNQLLPKLKKKLSAISKDVDMTFFRNCIDQLESTINFVSKVHIDTDTEHTKKMFEG
jgi:hypothetical protein